MPLVGRLIGVILLLLALVVICRDLIGWYDTGVLAPLSLGGLWFALSPASLRNAQAAIETHLSPRVRDPVLTNILALWAGLSIAILGGALVYLASLRDDQPRRRRRRRR